MSCEFSHGVKQEKKCSFACLLCDKQINPSSAKQILADDILKLILLLIREKRLDITCELSVRQTWTVKPYFLWKLKKKKKFQKSIWCTCNEHFKGYGLSNTVFTICIQTDRPEQTVQTQMRCHRMWHLIRVYTVCHSSSNFLTQNWVVNCTCSNFKMSMVSWWCVPALRAMQKLHGTL